MSPQPIDHVVVDGSNIATEGRSLPSLAQLDEAVQAFLDDYPADKLTVVVDATFGHRIAASEHDAYEEAILAGELVCPPAGAIGRGDAFVLQIADKAGAVVFSNDSFQEFHGDYAWLFEEGRLIGGKPVPEVGWVFVARAPVRGPTSRRATKSPRSSRSSRPARSQAGTRTSSLANKPLPTNPPPPPRPPRAAPAPAAVGDGDGAFHGDEADDADRNGNGNGNRRSSRRRGGARVEPVNDPMPFIEFVGAHPVGSTVEGIVERFSSHGAYVTLEDVHGYVPLKLLGDPPPRSAKELLTAGETRTFVISSFDPPRRSVDVIPADLTIATGAELAPADPEADATEPPATEATATEPDDNVQTPKKKPAAKSPAAKKATTRKAVTKKTTAKKAAPVKKATAKKATQAAAKQAAATKTAPDKKPAAKQAPTKQPAAKKPAAKKAPAKKTPAKKTPAKKTPAKATAAKETAAKATPAKKTPPDKPPAAKKASPKKQPAKMQPAKKSAPG